MKTIHVQRGSLDTIRDCIAKEAVIPELPKTNHMLQLKELYEKALENAYAAGAKTVYFPSVPRADSDSVMFQAVSIVYRTMKEFQASHDCPGDIRIVCDSDDILKLYMVVWNLYYAEDKSARMNDGRWD